MSFSKFAEPVDIHHQSAHVDGDDFILIVPQENAEDMRPKLREAFQKEVSRFYSEEEKMQDFIREKDREKKEQIYPLMDLSTATINVNQENFIHYGHLVSQADDLLRQAKQGVQELR